MKKIITFLLIAILPLFINAQIENPVKWAFSSRKINATTYELYMTATIEAGWHLFGQEPGKGPSPAVIKLNKNPQVTLSGKIRETGKLRQGFEKNFNVELKYYENQVVFIQKIIIGEKTVTKVSGSVTFMVCDDHQCLPPKSMGFSVQVGSK